MKVAYVYPTYWPYIRRGAERCIHDLSNYLARKGHDVDIITSKPGASRTDRDGLVNVNYLRQAVHPLGTRYWPLTRLYAFGLGAMRALLRKSYDVVHLWSYSSLATAPLLRKWRNLPYLFHLIVREHYWPGKIDRWLFHQLIHKADRVAALTPNGAEAIQDQYGVEAIVLPPPVDMDTFKPSVPKDPKRPKVLFTADLGDPRKGGPLLLRAWDEIHRRCPEAVLVLAGPFGLVGFDFAFEVYTLERLHLVRSPGARAAIEIRGPGSLQDLPRWYSEASVTVLPSVNEAFGMVVTESLACGTPVVCSSYSGPGEIITDNTVGATVPLKQPFDLLSTQAAHELAEAVIHAIEISRQPDISERCRAWADPWSLEHVGAATEAVLSEMASQNGQVNW